MAMSFSMLGPLEVRSAGVALELGPGLQRSLLVALLLEPNRVLPKDRIVATLWDGEPPKSARANVRTYVSRLRGVLVDERNAARVGARQSGYLLGVQEGEPDLEVFDRLAREGRAALAAGQWARAESRLAAALALWCGTAAQDVRRTMALGPRLAALDGSRLAATEDWITARQHLGAGPELIGLLRRLTGEHPLRERLWSRLIAAVYAGGDAGGALTVYRQARAALVENLGIDPGPELAALHRAILARDPALTGPTGPLPVRGGLIATHVNVAEAAARRGAAGPDDGAAGPARDRSPAGDAAARTRLQRAGDRAVRAGLHSRRRTAALIYTS